MHDVIASVFFSNISLHWQRPTKYLGQVAGATSISLDVTFDYCYDIVMRTDLALRST